MAEKLDLSKIKEEIATRRSGGNVTQSQFGETVGTGVTPRDSFLHGLMEAYKHNKPTSSTNLIKSVDNTVAANKGEQTRQSPTPTTTPKPTATPDYSNMPANFILPEELDEFVEGTGGGYDFTVPYDSENWFQVDNKNIFVMKFEHVDSNFPWTATSSNNVSVINTIRKPDYDYLVLKFIQSNTETVVVFEAINEDGIVGSSLGDAQEGIHFAVAIGK